MREYVKIYCCGNCIHYNWKKHKCNQGASEEGQATDNFYRDCPLGIHVEDNESNLPSAQQEIIRCKDCKFWHEDVANYISSIQRGGCKLIRGLTNGEFFCALGERRE